MTRSPPREPADAVRSRVPQARAVPVDGTCGLELVAGAGRARALRRGGAQSFEPIQIGTAWGRPWSTRGSISPGTVPQGWRSGGRLPPDTRVELVVDLGFDDEPGFQAEGLAWTPDGVIIKAVCPYNNHVPVDPEAPVDLYLEAAANPDVSGVRQLNGLGSSRPPRTVTPPLPATT